MQKIISDKSTATATEDTAHYLKAHVCFVPNVEVKEQILSDSFTP